MTKYSWQKIFRDFRNTYPELWCYGTTFIPHDQMTIMIINPMKGKFLYEGLNRKITWIEHWVDEETKKQQERELRIDMYQNFLREIDYYQKTTGISKSEIARRTGLSRQSIIRYLSGVKMPKISTMRKIADVLGLDI